MTQLYLIGNPLLKKLACANHGRYSLKMLGLSHQLNIIKTLSIKADLLYYGYSIAANKTSEAKYQ